ncbi:Rv3654c family TadE-like protein [Nocardioides allogilvus]|uniref:Rv3654c family TadE-like protein n=1 Tax=Nocardioides allogilvus TaxID=2072017 RepID=UPI000D307920|nr:Rv3654c family TadE-like protein [Nocardioides allogilvus]
MNGPARSRPGDERGAATVVVLAVSGLLMFVGLGLSGVAAIVVTQRSAQAAADLAALAGASAAVAGADACAAAGRIAADNGAALAACRLTGRVVTVAVRVDGPRLVDRRYDVTAEARAGPAVSG